MILGRSERLGRHQRHARHRHLVAHEQHLAVEHGRDAAYVYDNGGAGDSNLTKMIQYPGGGAAARVDRVLLRLARSPGRHQGGSAGQRGHDGTHRPIMYYSYDNLGEVDRRRTSTTATA